MKNISSALFKYRSYTPVPFLLPMLIFQNSSLQSLIIGFIISFTGELIRFWGVSWTGSETRTTGEAGGTFLIINGPYAYVRNPLYIGNILIYIGLGIMSFALFPFLQLAALIFFSWQYYLIVKEEENYLIKKFPDEFKKYLKNVPAYFPRFTPYKDPAVKNPPYNPKAGLKSEARSLQAFIGIALLLVILWLIRN